MFLRGSANLTHIAVIMSECLKPKTSKAELERIVKENGGKLVQTQAAAAKVICVADRRLVSVASLVKKGNCTIVRPAWVLDCVKQAEADVGRASLLLPYEEKCVCGFGQLDVRSPS